MDEHCGSDANADRDWDILMLLLTALVMMIVTVDAAPTPPNQKDSEGSEKGEMMVMAITIGHADSDGNCEWY